MHKQVNKSVTERERSKLNDIYKVRLPVYVLASIFLEDCPIHYWQPSLFTGKGQTFTTFYLQWWVTVQSYLTVKSNQTSYFGWRVTTTILSLSTIDKLSFRVGCTIIKLTLIVSQRYFPLNFNGLLFFKEVFKQIKYLGKKKNQNQKLKNVFSPWLMHSTGPSYLMFENLSIFSRGT